LIALVHGDHGPFSLPSPDAPHNRLQADAVSQGVT
jgi:hypothetical protein